MLQFECPACGKQLLVKNSREEAVITCPRCHERFELEVEDEPPEGDDYEVLDGADEAPAAAAPAGKKRQAVDAPPADKLKTKTKKKAKGKGKKKKKGAAVVPSAGRVALVIVLGLAVVLGGGSYFLYHVFTRPEPKKKWTEAEAVRDIPKWGGYLERDFTKNNAVTSVSYMGLSGSFKYEYLEPLAEFKELRKLNLGNTKSGDLVGDYLKDLTSLEILNLSQTNISDAGLRDLKSLVNLQELHLDNTLVSDSGLAALSGLKKLRRLSLRGVQADGHELKAAIPGLQISKN